MADTAMTLENEHDIVDRAKTDERAFEILYNHYFTRIYAYIFKRTGHHETTEDLVSKTFMKAFTHLDKYEHQGYSFGAWVYRIATNNLIDHYRKTGKKKTVDIEKAPDMQSSRPDPQEQAITTFEKAVVQKALKDLPDKYQEIINLKYFAQLSNQEIAAALGITANNAGVVIHRAVKKFHQVYQTYGEQ